MTAPKGSGGPPPGYEVTRYQHPDYYDDQQLPPVYVATAALYADDEPDDETHEQAVARCWAHLRRVTESEPAPPTDGPTDETEPLVKLRMVRGLYREACEQRDSMTAALAESRAEVERLRADQRDLQVSFDRTIDREDALRAEVERLIALGLLDMECRRDNERRIAGLQDVICKAHYELSCAANACNDAEICAEIDRVRKLLDRALATTQEPPAKEPT